MSIEWNLIRLADPVHGIVTKNVHKTLARDGGAQGLGEYRVTGGGGGPGVGWVVVGGMTSVKSLKIDIEERTRHCKSLLLKIT